MYSRKKQKEPIISPCPFCGGVGLLGEVENAADSIFSNGTYWVECGKCGASIKRTYSATQAVREWNTRYFEKEN